ncbi:MAG: HIT domain-containing protein [bacterium]|nr:MAG: HIT domain-containing protein [bacterium]
MKVLWAPWRMEYILADKGQECFLCDLAGALPSEDNLLLYRDDLAMVVMNRYPYNNGHILVAPVAHTADLNELTQAEYSRTMELFRFSLKALERHMEPEGVNAGLNLGKTGGAGLEEHVHFHIVPRWHGDTNFMPVIANTRVIPEAIRETYRGLQPFFEKYGE